MATINGVLKAWMVPPDYPDAARHAEAVLAKLAGWRSEGVLWGVSADTVSYNTCINCWKESRIPGAAQRATDILRLMEDATTAVVPDAVSYATCIRSGGRAYANGRQSGGGTRTLELLQFMEQLHSSGEYADLSLDRYTFNICCAVARKALLKTPTNCCRGWKTRTAKEIPL